MTGHAPGYGRSTRLTAAGADSAAASASRMRDDWIMTYCDDWDADSSPSNPLPDPCRLLIRARRAARMGSVEQSVRRRRDTHRNAVDMVVLHRDTTAGHASAQCSTGVCRQKLAMCACTAPSRVLEGATAGQHRPDPGPARRLAAASPAFRTHVIIYDRDPALGGAWAALRARYRARGAKVNNQWRTVCATTPAPPSAPCGLSGSLARGRAVAAHIISRNFHHMIG